MKKSFKDYFSPERTREFINEINEIFHNILVELGICGEEDALEEVPELTEEQGKLAGQKIKERIRAKILDKGEDIASLYLAISDRDSLKVEELKSQVTLDEYFETLAISFHINSFERNDEIVKFLLTETEIKIKDYFELKAWALSIFAEVKYETEWNNEIIELLLEENKLAHEKLFEEILGALGASYFSDQFLINNYFRFIRDANKPLIIQVSRDEGQTFHEEERSLLIMALDFERLELAEWLIYQKGACVLPIEVGDLIHRPYISDELLIFYFNNTLDVNKPIIIRADTSTETFYKEERSLLFTVLGCERLKLIEWLIDKKAQFLPKEVVFLLKYDRFSDKLLISLFKNMEDINKPITKQIYKTGDQLFQEGDGSLLSEVLQLLRFELAKWLID